MAAARSAFSAGSVSRLGLAATASCPCGRIPFSAAWRSPATATAGDLRQFEREVRSRTGIKYTGVDSRYDPLFGWFQKHREAVSQTESPRGQQSVDLPHL